MRQSLITRETHFVATVNSLQEPFTIRLRPNVLSKPRFRTPSTQLCRSSLPLIVAPSDMVETAFPCLVASRRQLRPHAPQALSLASSRSRAPSRSCGPTSCRPAPWASPQQVLRRGARFAIHGTRMATPRSSAAPRHAGPGQQPVRRAGAGQCREKMRIIE
jgi:hypothetical protein